MVMTGTKELKNGLSRYLRIVRQGTPVVVTDRGKPIAEIRPLGVPAAASTIDSRLADLAARGVLVLPKRKKLKPFRPVILRGSPISATIIKDRR